jgi:geranylgeranyl diphosphate synthase type I
MGIYEEAIDLLRQQPAAKHWQDMDSALQRAAQRRPVAWHFPIRACEAVGGLGDLARPAVAAITCIHMAIILVDDILDNDPRGLFHQVGAGRAANLAIGLNSLGIQVLLTTNQPVESIVVLNEMTGSTALGQELDVQNAKTEEEYWAVTRAKSSPYFAAALHLGALCGGADSATCAQLKTFGAIYGEIMQLHDDLNDSLENPANVDWVSGRSPLPILYAQVVEHPDRQRFISLRDQVSDVSKLEEAQSILIRSGAISYSVHQLALRQQRAESLLQTIQLRDRAPLQEILEEAIAPVKNLFKKLGSELPALS